MKKKMLIGISLVVMGVFTIFESNAKAELTIARENAEAIMLNDDFDCEVYCEPSNTVIACVLIYSGGDYRICPDMGKCPYLKTDDGVDQGKF